MQTQRTISGSSILELWASHSSGLVTNLCEIVFALVGAFAVDYAVVKWRSELCKPEMSRDIGNALEVFKVERHERHIECLVLGLLRARRLYLDPKLLDVLGQVGA